MIIIFAQNFLPPEPLDDEHRAILGQVKSDLGDWSLDTLALDEVTGRPLYFVASAIFDVHDMVRTLGVRQVRVFPYLFISFDSMTEY